MNFFEILIPFLTDIAFHINDSKSYLNFKMVCKLFYGSTKSLDESKLIQFSIETFGENPLVRRELPNGVSHGKSIVRAAGLDGPNFYMVNFHNQGKVLRQVFIGKVSINDTKKLPNGKLLKAFYKTRYPVIPAQVAIDIAKDLDLIPSYFPKEGIAYGIILKDADKEVAKCFSSKNELLQKTIKTGNCKLLFKYENGKLVSRQKSVEEWGEFILFSIFVGNHYEFYPNGKIKCITCYSDEGDMMEERIF